MAEKNMSAKRICINRGGWSNGGRSVSEFATRIVRMSQVIVSLLESSLLLGGEDQHRVGMVTAKQANSVRTSPIFAKHCMQIVRTAFGWNLAPC